VTQLLRISLSMAGTNLGIIKIELVNATITLGKLKKRIMNKKD